MAPLPAIGLLAADVPTLDTGNNAWMLASAALVLLMTPGLAFFYGGMVRRKIGHQHADDVVLGHGHRRHRVRPLGLLDVVLVPTYSAGCSAIR